VGGPSSIIFQFLFQSIKPSLVETGCSSFIRAVWHVTSDPNGIRTCFDDSYPRASADVLLEGTRERSDRRGLLRTSPDVITFVITIPVQRNFKSGGHLHARND